MFSYICLWLFVYLFHPLANTLIKVSQCIKKKEKKNRHTPTTTMLSVCLSCCPTPCLSASVCPSIRLFVLPRLLLRVAYLSPGRSVSILIYVPLPPPLTVSVCLYLSHPLRLLFACQLVILSSVCWSVYSIIIPLPVPPCLSVSSPRSSSVFPASDSCTRYPSVCMCLSCLTVCFLSV